MQWEDKLRNDTQIGSNEITSPPILAINPNPVKDLLKISLTLPAPSSVKLQIFNMNGQLVQNFESQNVESNIYKKEWNIPSSLARGVYIVKASTAWGEIAEKVVLLE